jgi:hypothetical protein
MSSPVLVMIIVGTQESAISSGFAPYPINYGILLDIVSDGFS